MKAGFIYRSRRSQLYDKLKRQVTVEFAAELEQATGWRRGWVRWKRKLALAIRYNQLLFSRNETFVTLPVTSIFQR